MPHWQICQQLVGVITYGIELPVPILSKLWWFCQTFWCLHFIVAKKQIHRILHSTAHDFWVQYLKTVAQHFNDYITTSTQQIFNVCLRMTGSRLSLLYTIRTNKHPMRCKAELAWKCQFTPTLTRKLRQTDPFFCVPFSVQFWFIGR